MRAWASRALRGCTCYERYQPFSLRYHTHVSSRCQALKPNLHLYSFSLEVTSVAVQTRGDCAWPRAEFSTPQLPEAASPQNELTSFSWSWSCRKNKLACTLRLNTGRSTLVAGFVGPTVAWQISACGVAFFSGLCDGFMTQQDLGLDLNAREPPEFCRDGIS